MWRRIAIAFGILVFTGVAVVWYFWHQATALPDWYQPDSESLEYSDETDPGADLQWVMVPDEEGGDEEPPASDGATSKPARKAGKSYELRGFHRRGKHSGKSSAVKASKAVLKDGKLEAGVVLDLSKVSTDKLTDRDRGLYDKAVANFPGITRRDVYVGVEDQPVTEDGVLQLGASPQIRVGNLRYPLDKAAAKLGMSPAQLRAELDRELQRLGVKDPSAQ